MTPERQKLVTDNLALVTWLVDRVIGRRKVGWRGYRDDLIAEGQLGLVIAAGRFDPERGVKFATYAFYWVRQRILRAMEVQGRADRVVRDDCLHEVTVASSHESDHDAVEVSDRVTTALGALPPRQALVLRLRHCEGQTLEVVGGRIGVSKEMARQIQRKAEAWLRDNCPQLEELL